jgi:O-antigen/teichoic acid export membrane protein
LTVSSIGFLLLSLFFYFGESTILGWYEKDAVLFRENYNYIYLVVFFMIFFNILDAYLQVNKKSVVQNVLQTIGLRLLFLVLIILYSFDLLSFPEMVAGYALAYGIVFLVLMGYTVYLKQWHIRPNFNKFDKPMRKNIVRFMIYSLLGVGSTYLANYVDILMVGNLAANGLYDVAIYATSFYIASVVVVPFRAVIRIIPIFISQAWKENDMDSIQLYYRKVTNSQLIFGGIIFLGIWLNVDGILSFLPAEYAAGKYVIGLVLIGKFFDAVTGVNGTIIQYSNFYHYLLYFNVALLILVVGTNLVFIPWMGIEGAALATLISTLAFNIIKSGLIWFKMGIHPFNRNSLFIIMLLVAAYFVIAFFLPHFNNVLVDLGVRSVLLVVGVAGFAYWFDLSEDFTSLSNKLLKAARIRR